MSDLPALFVSHGAPTLILTPGAARDFLSTLSSGIPTPRAILAVSAHWESVVPSVTTAARPQTIHDFYGFPPELYEIRYPAPGATSVASRAAELLAAAHFKVHEDPVRGLDHGAWVPMALMYPEAGIPVAQLSIQTPLGPEHHFRLGAALRPLRSEGVLILSSGGSSHNLRELVRSDGEPAPPAWVSDFREWVARQTEAGKIDDLLQYRTRAPEAVRNHPTEEHFLPFFVALGAGSSPARGKRIHSSTTFGVLAMDAYRFD